MQSKLPSLEDGPSDSRVYAQLRNLQRVQRTYISEGVDCILQTLQDIVGDWDIVKNTLKRLRIL